MGSRNEREGSTPVSDVNSLFRELKPDVELVADALFEATQVFVRERGDFLPHGAVLPHGGELRLIMAADEESLRDDRPVSALTELPLLHEALREVAKRERLRAVGVCESVTITPGGQKPTMAIKVLLEHRRGLCVALYMPFRRSRLLGCKFGEIIVKEAAPEVAPWKEVEAG